MPNSLIRLSAAMLLLVSCSKKELMYSNTNYPASISRPILVKDTIVIRPLPRTTFSTCINSYHDFILTIGKSQLSINKIVLENGQEYTLGSELSEVIYTAKEGRSTSSIFNSVLSIRHNLQGYSQTFTQEVWTLGCVYQANALPPFTNLVYRGNLYCINTCFMWPVVIGTDVPQISFIYAD